MLFFYLFLYLILRKNIIINTVKAGKTPKEEEEDITLIQNEKNMTREEHKSVYRKIYFDDSHNHKGELTSIKPSAPTICSNHLVGEIFTIEDNFKKATKSKKPYYIKHEYSKVLKNYSPQLTTDHFLSIRTNVMNVYKTVNYYKSINGLKALKLSLQTQYSMIKHHYSEITPIYTRIAHDQAEMNKLISAWKNFEKICDDIIKTKNAYFIWINPKHSGNEVTNASKYRYALDIQKSQSLFLNLIEYKTTLENMKLIKSFDSKKIIKMLSKNKLSKIKEGIKETLNLIKSFETNKLILPCGEFYIINTFENTLNRYELKIKNDNILEREIEKFSLYLDNISEFNNSLALVHEEIYKSDSIYSKHCDLFSKNYRYILIDLRNLISTIICLKEEIPPIEFWYSRLKKTNDTHVLASIIIEHLNSPTYKRYMQELLELQFALKFII